MTGWAWPGATELEKFADRHGLLLVTIADLIRLPPPDRTAGAPHRRTPGCRPSTVSSAASPTRA